VLDLLPDRDADSVANWFQTHKGIEIISRDRGYIYRKGATVGAPHAMQVADRFHLMKNLRDAFGRFLEGQSQNCLNRGLVSSIWADDFAFQSCLWRFIAYSFATGIPGTAFVGMGH
jgi:hypothetical protein